jgi:hypothetical protein
MREKFKYMGRDVKISMNKSETEATITIEKKHFKTRLHTEGKPEDNYIKLWMCPEAYTMTETPEAMAKHIVQYWYQFT